SSSVRRPHWPRWRDALVLVQPATVDHWHLEGSIDAGGVGCDVLENRASIRNVERGLIRQMAAEHRLCGAPRILRRITQAGAHSLRRHGVELSTLPADGAITGVVDVPRKSHRPTHVDLAGEITVRATCG